ncbi:Calcium release activated channel regulator 2A [Halocaridina rubra]|uniref:Calcium release activated channel regulator 2A n=1 Tax=Halocaridina rubra TaxID=373956 RepID=A0AAN8WY51_HALRR
MIAEEEVDKDITSWEQRAEQLYSLCDRESKGFITKRDLQRLWGELPLGPDELEGVFDSLDQDQNGYLTLEEFTDGFGHHLGLVVEFRADEDNIGKDSDNEEDLQEHNEDDTISPSSRQIDDILNTFAKHNFDISTTMIESVWRDVCEETEDNAGLEKLVVALLQELARVKAEHMHLETALATKTEHYNQQVSSLYEELESEITGEHKRTEKDQKKRREQALEALEQEVQDRDAALKQLQEDSAALNERVERLVASELTAKQENVRLMQHLNKVEEELSRKESEVRELKTTLDHIKKNTKDEKILRAQRAIKVCEGIALERESLVSQLDILRTINTQLRDEQDQSQPQLLENSTRPTEGKQGSGILKQDSSNVPVAIKRKSLSISALSTSNDTEDLFTSSNFDPNTNTKQQRLLAPLHLTPSGHQDIMSELVETQSSDLEHDESYFLNSKLGTSSTLSPPTLSTNKATETNLLQELMESPRLCSSCGTAIVSQPVTVVERKPRVTFAKKDSATQTSPKLLLKAFSSEFLTGSTLPHKSPSLSPDVVMPAQIVSGNNAMKTNKSSIIMTNRRDPDVTKNYCSLKREGDLSPHSATLILHHPGKRTPPDLVQTHTSTAYIHTQHRHYSYAHIAVTDPVSFVHSEESNTLQKPSEGISQTLENKNEITLCRSPNDMELTRKATVKQKEYESEPIKEAETNSIHQNSEDGINESNNTSGKETLSRTTSLTLIEHTYDKLHDLKTLKDNIKNYIHDKSHLSQKGDNEQFGGQANGELSDVPKKLADSTRIFKVVFIGDSGVGKTTFIHRASIGEYRSDFGATVGVDYRLMEIVVGGIHALMQLWDTAGQERYKAITRQYYRKADGVVVMYDVTNERSFLSVADWISSVREYGDRNMVMAVIGNKKDLHKAKRVDFEVASKFAKPHNSLLYECSAATGNGVQEVMKHLAALLTTDQQHDIDTSATLTLHRSPKSNNPKCC